MTLPPRSAISVMVGALRSMRETSATSPSCMGTLKSTRTRTRLPFTSAPSRVRKRMTASSAELAHCHRGIDHPIGEAPLVIVPRHHAHQRAVDHLGLIDMEDRRVRIVVEIGGDVGRL